MKRVFRIFANLVMMVIVCSISFAQDTESAKEKVEVLFQRAFEHHKLREYEKAVEYYTKVIELDEKHFNACWNRGRIYSYQEKHDLAIADFRKIIALKPNFGNAYGELGDSLLAQGKFAEAKDFYQKAYDFVPGKMDWALGLGHVYLLTGDTTTARTYYEKTLSLMRSEKEFERSIASFGWLIRKGWAVEACRQELAWLIQEFDTV